MPGRSSHSDKYRYWGEAPIVSGTTLTSRDGTYLFTYTIANPESGMIFYSAQKVQPHPEPVVKPEPDKRTVPTGPPNVTVPLPIPLPRSSPLPRVATPTLIRAGLGRAGVWGLAAWAIYEYGKDYLNTQKRNTKNMSDDMQKAYYDALMMHN